MPHIIRLRGFWDISTEAGCTHHTRSFGKPRKLDAGEGVWLVCSHLAASAEVVLNGEAIANQTASGPLAVDITYRLQERNKVEFAVSSAEPLGEVQIEIRG